MEAVNQSVRCSDERPIQPLTATTQNADIADLRQEYAELKSANASLERQLREGLQVTSSLQPFVGMDGCTGTMTYASILSVHLLEPASQISWSVYLHITILTVCGRTPTAAMAP